MEILGIVTGLRKKETKMARNKDYKYAAPIVTTILNRYPSDRRMRDLEIKRDAARFREITKERGQK